MVGAGVDGHSSTSRIGKSRSDSIKRALEVAVGRLGEATEEGGLICARQIGHACEKLFPEY